MCGRFAFFSPTDAVAALFDVEFPLAVEPHYNIAPTQYVVALRHAESKPDPTMSDSKPEPAMLRWGLVPAWAKDPVIGNRMINARRETVAEKPSFRAAFKRRRCVILADGFYEWQKTADGKVPHFISLKSSAPFPMAGLWERWGEGDARIETCTIITTAAGPVITPLHHRMPVILTPENALRWIDPATDPGVAGELLKEAHDENLRYWPVSRAVNNPAHQGAGLIESDESIEQDK
jgi:putative SOS response-associated peptidase YedK